MNGDFHVTFVSPTVSTVDRRIIMNLSWHQFFCLSCCLCARRQMESSLERRTLQRRLNISVSGPPSDAVTKVDETTKPPKNGWRDSDTHISLTQITRRQCITGYLRPVSNVHNPQARFYFDTRQADNDGVWLKNGTPAWTCPCKYALALSNSWPWTWVLLPWLKKGATSGAFSSSSTKIRCYFLSSKNEKASNASLCTCFGRPHWVEMETYDSARLIAVLNLYRLDLRWWHPSLYRHASTIMNFGQSIRKSEDVRCVMADGALCGPCSPDSIYQATLIQSLCWRTTWCVVCVEAFWHALFPRRPICHASIDYEMLPI